MSAEDEGKSEAPQQAAPKHRRRRTWIRYLVALVVLAAAGYWGALEVKQRFTHVYEYDARIAAELVTVSSRVSGWVTKIHITEGDRVAKGDVIVEIDGREAQLLLDQLAAQINGVQAERDRLAAERELVDRQTSSRYQTQKSEIHTYETEVAALETQLEIGRNEFERNKNLFDKKIVSRRQYDEALAAMQLMEGQHRTAVAELQASRAKLLEAEAERMRLNVIDSAIAKLAHEEAVLQAQWQQQKLDYSDRAIKAPTDAVVDRVFVDQGEYVTSGQRLALVHNPDYIWIDANIKETDIRKLKVGQTVEVSVDAYPKTLFRGEVMIIGHATTAQFALLPSPNPSGNFTKITQRLPVRIAIEQKDGLLRPGMMVEVNIDIQN